MSTGLGRSSREGNGNPLQYSCLENPHGQRSLAGYSPRGRKSQTRLRVKPPPPPQSSPWKSGCIAFKKPETPPAPQSLRILLSSNSSVVWGNLFRIWGAPPLTWTWDPVNCFTQKALRRTCHRITEDTGTSVMEDDVCAGLLMCTADDILQIRMCLLGGELGNAGPARDLGGGKPAPSASLEAGTRQFHSTCPFCSNKDSTAEWWY